MGSDGKEEHYESMLYNYETTNKKYFRYDKIRPVIKTEHKATKRLKDTHALNGWNAPKVPFNLMHKPKEIIRTNPWDLQKPVKELEDVTRDEVQKNRPRLVMTPAVSLDDVEPVARKVLVDDMYTSTSALMSRRSGAVVAPGVRAPLSARPAPAVPIKLRKLSPLYVSPEWRMDSVTWENRQLRQYCRPDKHFWLNFEPGRDVYKETAQCSKDKRVSETTKV